MREAVPAQTQRVCSVGTPSSVVASCTCPEMDLRGWAQRRAVSPEHQQACYSSSTPPTYDGRLLQWREKGCLQVFGHNTNTTPSSARWAGSSSLNCPKPFGSQGRSRPGSFPFLFLSSLPLPPGWGTWEKAMWAGGQERMPLCLGMVGGKIQEPLKEGRVHRGIMCRTRGGWGKKETGKKRHHHLLASLHCYLSFPRFLNSTKGSAESHPIPTSSSSDEPLKPRIYSSSGGLSKDGDEVAAPWALQVTHCS